MYMSAKPNTVQLLSTRLDKLVRERAPPGICMSIDAYNILQWHARKRNRAGKLQHNSNISASIMTSGSLQPHRLRQKMLLIFCRAYLLLKHSGTFCDHCWNVLQMLSHSFCSWLGHHCQSRTYRLDLLDCKQAVQVCK